MDRMTKAPARRVLAVGVALLLGAQPALAQWDSMPLPAGADLASLGHLTVDAAVWSLAASDTRRAILTFDHYPDDTEIGALGAAGVDVYSYDTLPMIVVRADGARLRNLVGLRGLSSIYLDRELDDLTGVIPWVAQTADSRRVALIDSRGPRLLATDGQPRAAKRPLTVVAALEGFDWVFKNRREHGIEIIANGWGNAGPLSSNDPLGIAIKAAQDAGIAVVFAGAGHE
ncbi:MAG TPA: hypothetical protein VF405_15760 [Gammaproteobacteria bacterium]